MTNISVLQTYPSPPNNNSENAFLKSTQQFSDADESPSRGGDESPSRDADESPSSFSNIPLPHPHPSSAEFDFQSFIFH
ncbi:hypothetical protein ACS0TY_025994 [Phlomoides rotata]